MFTITVQVEKGENTLEPMESHYLFSYLVRFGNKEGLNILSDSPVVLQGELLDTFKNYVHEALSALLLDCYEEPSQKRRSKYPGRYMKFSFEKKKYAVDYTFFGVGRLMYNLKRMIELLDEAISCGQRVELSLSGFSERIGV